MLISLRYNFIFVANLKTASTSIEDALKEYSDISILRSEWGKHISISDIQQHYKYVIDRIGFENFFKFGIIRHPEDYLKSLYLSHTHDKFKNNPRLYTGNLNFEQFIYLWGEANKGQMRPQYTRFIDNKGNILINYIIKYDDLNEQLLNILKIIGIPAIKFDKKNVSPKKNIKIEDSTLKYIRKYYDMDYYIYNKLTNREIYGKTINIMEVKE